MTSTELLPGVVESQSDCKFKCEGDARRHDGASSDDFFEPELFHEASPQAGSNLYGTFTPDAGPPAGGGPHEHEVLPWVPGERQKFQTSRESWPTWKRCSTNGTARTQ